MQADPEGIHPWRVDDRSLVEAVTSGDRDAFEAIVVREATAVFRTCYRILGRVGDAEDAAQESFVIAYRSLGTFRGEGSLAGWLARIATRQALRRLGQRRETEPLDVPGTPASNLAGGPDPLGAAIAAERQRVIRRAVASLGEPYREVVALRFFAELSLNEIAESTGRPIGTVKTHLHRGLARLRERLGPDGLA